MTKRPGFVPITEVGEHTDAISVYNLGLPSGFDIDRLYLHVGRTERLARLSDIGELSVIGFRGDTTEKHTGVGGISSDGTGIATRVGAITKAKTHAIERTDIEASHGPAYDWTSGVVKINNAEIDERIKVDDKKWDRGLVDPFARAHYMDRAMRLGITALGRENTFNGDVARTLIESGSTEALRVALWMVLYGLSPTNAIMVDVGVRAGVLNGIVHAINLARHKEGRADHPLPPRKWSLIGKHKFYDRLLLAHVYGASTRLVAAG